MATAGSLLGVKLTKGFPVGKVNFLDLAPLNFFEFLVAIGEQELVVMLEEMDHPKPISEIFHNKLISLLKYYFIIGGMPEAVATYLKTDNLEQVRVVQKEILDAYILDFVISTEHHVFPLEVKADFSKKKKSLTVYDEKFSKEGNALLILSRASLRNFSLDGKLVNYPLYAISLFPRFRLKIAK